MSDIGKYYSQANPRLGSTGISLSGTVASISGATLSFSAPIFGATDYTGYCFVMEGQTAEVSSNTTDTITLAQALQYTVPTPSFSTNDRTGKAYITGTTTLIGAGSTYYILLYPDTDVAYTANMGNPPVGKLEARFCTICQVPYRIDDGMQRFRGLWYCKYCRQTAAWILRQEKQKAWTPKGRSKEPADSPFIVVNGPPPNTAT